MVLSDLKKGEKAAVTDISSLDHVMKKRLIQFGVREGSVVQLKSKLPFGGPYVIEYKKQQIGIRLTAAQQIEVERA